MEDPRDLIRTRSYGTPDTVMPHPVYGPLGWISVGNPGDATFDTVTQLLHAAHAAARARYERR